MSPSQSLSVLILAVCLALITQAHIIDKRQTYQYDPYLVSYAHPHPGTKVRQGYLARYAPQDWPKCFCVLKINHNGVSGAEILYSSNYDDAERRYSRNMMKWTGESRFSPYEKSDLRYPNWHKEFVNRRV